MSGWKVGWIPEPLSQKYGAQRLVGPIFNRSLKRANGSASIDAPVFARGFAAIEAEFVFQLAKDAPANVTEWSHRNGTSLRENHVHRNRDRQQSPAEHQ